MKKTGKVYLLDTNIVVDYFGGDKKIKDRLSNEIIINLPSIAIGELYFGAYLSSKVEKKINEIEGFIQEVPIVYVEEETAKFYGQIKSQLKEDGTPIPENDIWISAISIQYGFTIATRDHHFDKPKGIRVEYW